MARAEAPHGTRFQIATGSTLVGVGAPIHLFLPDVARALGAECVVPDLAGVANALGAVAGNVAASVSVTIRPEGDGFQVFAPSEGGFAESLEEAVRVAREISGR